MAPGRTPAARDTLWRQRLIDELDRNATERLTCITAPAGYGKTVLLAQWHEARPSAGITFVTCDDRDGDLCHLTCRLLRVFRGPDEAGTLGSCDEQPSSGARLVDTLASAAADVPGEAVLVLDNAEVLPPSALSALATLMASSPERLHFVVASRKDLLPMARAVGRAAEVAVVTPAQLSFDRQEVADLAEQLGTALDADALDELFTGTGGWPYGVLNVLRRYREDQPGTLAQVLARPDRAARQYVWQEVLGQLPRRIKDAALALAVPDAFSAALTDALTGGHDGAWVIDELASSGLLGHQGTRDDVAIYKFPTFLRACLRSELHSRAPGNEERLLGTAAEWSLRSGELLAAVEYHLRAGHFEEAAELMTEHAYELYRAGQAPDVLRLARPFLWPLRRANEAVTLFLAAMSLVAGEATAAEELLLEFDKGPCDEPELSKWADGLRCLLIEFHAPAQDVLDRAQNVLERDGLATEDHLRDGTGPRHAALLTGIAYLGGGQALAGLDRHEEAWRWYRAGLADVHLPPELRAKLLAALARSEAIAGQLTAAQRHANQSLVLISDLRTEMRRTLGHAETYLGLAIVALEQGGQGWQEAVAQLLDDAEERARRGRRTNLLAEVAVHRARLFLLVGRPDEGLALLAGLRTSGNPDPAPEVESRLWAVKAELLIANGQHAKAAYVLRAAPLETSDVLAVRAHLAVEAHDRGSLVRCIRSWPDVSRRPRARVLKLLCQAAVDALGGLAQDAHRHLDDAIRQARLEGLNQVFSEAGNAIFDLVARPHPTTQRSPGAARLAPPPATPQTSGVAITSQELVVLRALATGANNRALATSLFISTNTLKTHLQHIYAKLGVTNRFQAVRRATALGLLADASEPATTADPR